MFEYVTFFLLDRIDGTSMRVHPKNDVFFGFHFSLKGCNQCLGLSMSEPLTGLALSCSGALQVGMASTVTTTRTLAAGKLR